MRHVHRNPVGAAVVLVAEEDSLADGVEEEDAETTSCLNAREEKVLSVKVVVAINDMNRRGHDAHLYKHDGKVWVEIDQCMLASFAEIEELVDGVHSFEELEELFKKRHAQELG
jgi:hypothetical protein